MSIKTYQDIELMREGGHKLAGIFSRVLPSIADGMSTKALADIVVAEFKKEKLISAVLGYEGFPEAVCISINNEVVHGIPKKDRKIRDGDIVSLDLTAKYKGMVVDSARSVYVGDDAPAEIQNLLSNTQKALMAGIDAISGNGTKVGDIGSAIQAVLDRAGLGIVRDLVGHGVGYSVHEDPNIPNYGVSGTGTTLRAGMTIAVEPMATLGDWRVNILSDGWTVVTRDSSLAAHFEHTVLITDKGAEILTED